MRSLIAKFAGKLERDRSVIPGRVGIAAQDDAMLSEGAPDLSRLAADVLSRLSCLGVVAASPSLPFAEFLLRRASADAEAIVPLDTETRTFLHDIPIVRRVKLAEAPARAIAALLSNRKGVIAEGVGIVASGPVTLEQAYIHYSSVFHAAFVKYLLDALEAGFVLPERFFTEAGSSGEGIDVPPIDRARFGEELTKYYRIRGLRDDGSFPDDGFLDRQP